MSNPKLAKEKVYKTEIVLVVESDHPLSKSELARVKKSLAGNWVYPLSFDLAPFKAKH